jgi:hypothetical protein
LLSSHYPMLMAQKSKSNGTNGTILWVHIQMICTLRMGGVALLEWYIESRHMHVRLITLSINFDYTVSMEKCVDYCLYNLDQWVSID